MENDAATQLVFVDFENVPSVDLGAISGHPAHVTLLIGKNQKKLDIGLVQQIRVLAAQIELVEVGASGHNALDFTLAFYLGRAVQRSPAAQFSIVSRDKDFEPMIGHLRATGINVARYDSFAALPFLPRPKPVIPARRVVPPRAGPAGRPGGPAERFARLVESFQGGPQNRPKKRTKLLSHIANFYGKNLTDAKAEDVLRDLSSSGVLSIDSNGKVSYTMTG
jgi:hypothetical protein